MPRTPRMKLAPKKTAKQIAAATKNILAYEKKDDHQNILIGFVLGFSVCLIAVFVGIGLSSKF